MLLERIGKIIPKRDLIAGFAREQRILIATRVKGIQHQDRG